MGFRRYGRSSPPRGRQEAAGGSGATAARGAAGGSRAVGGAERATGGAERATDGRFSEAAVDKSRARAGLWAVVASDAAIVAIAVFGVVWLPGKSAAQSVQVDFVAILTAAFTAVSTMTTAYLSVKSMSHTAQRTQERSRPDGGRAPGT